MRVTLYDSEDKKLDWALIWDNKIP
jgi:hypothetical protein